MSGAWATALQFAPPELADYGPQRADGNLVKCSLLALDAIIDKLGEGEAVADVKRAA